MSKITGNIPYEYKNCPIGGGGYVTGFAFHPKDKNILYARTDIGGVYKYSFERKIWISLCDHVTAEDLAQTYPLSIAVDENNPDVLLSACGNKQKNYLSISLDAGKTFIDKPLPCPVHGNEVGRSTGERLVYKNGIVWFASQSKGLFKSENLGDSWETVDVAGETNLTFIWLSPDEKIIIVGTSGEKNSADKVHRGNTLYASYNGGESFEPLTAPLGYDDDRCDYIGFVPQKIAFDGQHIYITFCQSGKIVFGGMGAYSCDTGSAFDGRIYRYKISGSKVRFDKDITPADELYGDENSNRKIVGAYCALDFHSNTLYASTICRRDCDVIYRSFDQGESWEKILSGLEIGEIDWRIPYLTPKYNGNRSCIHWISDFKVSPHDENFAVFNTGTGVFFTENLTFPTVKFASLCDGIEETVHLNVYSPNGGDVQVIDIVGDLGGFAFTNVDNYCENSFDDENGNRYITSLNADFTDTNPTYVLCTPRGNWTGKTKGGVILSTDQCKTWRLLNYPIGITDDIDKAIEKIKQPNVDSGWVALSADSKRIIWTLQYKHSFSSSTTVFTDNEGESWAKSEFFDAQNNPVGTCNIKIFADRVDPDVFYGVTNEYRFFVSVDKGETFREISTNPIAFKTRQKCEFRCENNVFGRIWIANGIDGLYLSQFDKASFSIEITNVLSDGEYARCVGFGMGKSDIPMLFIAGKLCGEYGFYRSENYGESWQRINTAAQQFGDTNAICGDPRRFGRLYIATGSRGLLYGGPDGGRPNSRRRSLIGC